MSRGDRESTGAGEGDAVEAKEPWAHGPNPGAKSLADAGVRGAMALRGELARAWRPHGEEDLLTGSTRQRSKEVRLVQFKTSGTVLTVRSRSDGS